VPISIIGGVEMLWLRLGRPSYFSCLQGTGALFSRGTALAYGHRRSSLFPLKELDFDDCLERDDGQPLFRCPSTSNAPASARPTWIM